MKLDDGTLKTRTPVEALSIFGLRHPFGAQDYLWGTLPPAHAGGYYTPALRACANPK